MALNFLYFVSLSFCTVFLKSSVKFYSHFNNSLCSSFQLTLLTVKSVTSWQYMYLGAIYFSLYNNSRVCSCFLCSTNLKIKTSCKIFKLSGISVLVPHVDHPKAYFFCPLTYCTPDFLRCYSLFYVFLSYRVLVFLIYLAICSSLCFIVHSPAWVFISLLPVTVREGQDKLLRGKVSGACPLVWVLSFLPEWGSAATCDSTALKPSAHPYCFSLEHNASVGCCLAQAGNGGELWG